MIAPLLLNVVKSSLKSFYDIDPMVVEHMSTSLKMQLHLVGRYSVEVFQVVGRSVRSGIGLIEQLGSAA